MRNVNRSEVEGMIGGLPWARPIGEWPTEYLDKALEGDTLDESPRLSAAIKAERGTRG